MFDGLVPPHLCARKCLPQWSVFDGFAGPTRRRIAWHELDEFVERGRLFASERCRSFPGLLAQWDTLLADCDGDPSRGDWSHFRPLHVDREEDWSDWLQHFIASSQSGAFSWQLFNRSDLPSAGSCVRATVLREDVVQHRRADLVITWGDSTRTHVEIKVGDRGFSKTSETAAQLEKKYPAPRWSHYVLLPAEDVTHWNAVDQPEAPAINVLTWDDVATALRRALRREDETRRWKLWAHGFCGLVEQRLLGHPLASTGVSSLSSLARRMHQIAIMRRGLDDV